MYNLMWYREIKNFKGAWEEILGCNPKELKRQDIFLDGCCWALILGWQLDVTEGFC